MTDIIIRQDGHAGRITLNRPKALNALTWEMCLAIEEALIAWRDDAAVKLIMIDGAGDRAFCSGGDIAEMYAAGLRGDYDYGRRFWRDEYRLNAMIHTYPKPIVTFLHGFTMGGGVGVGCHASHRIVCEDSQIALPECGIGLVPDVGGSMLLGRAPGRCGEFLGLTGDRMDAADALYAGFADSFVPFAEWETLKQDLTTQADLGVIAHAAGTRDPSRLAGWQSQIDSVFGADTLGDIYRAMPQETGPAITYARKKMDRNAPLAMACATQFIRRARGSNRIEYALDQEFRFTYRCVEQGDFIEGIRAAIIDRDHAPRWQHASWQDVTGGDVLRMTLPLGKDGLDWKDNT